MKGLKRKERSSLLRLSFKNLDHAEAFLLIFKLESIVRKLELETPLCFWKNATDIDCD